MKKNIQVYINPINKSNYIQPNLQATTIKKRTKLTLTLASAYKQTNKQNSEKNKNKPSNKKTNEKVNHKNTKSKKNAKYH